MEADELFEHALTSLPEAVGDLLRDGLDPGPFVFASFDGASQLGIALIASDLAGDLGGTRGACVRRSWTACPSSTKLPFRRPC